MPTTAEIYRKRLGRLDPESEMAYRDSTLQMARDTGEGPRMDDRMGGDAKPSYLEQPGQPPRPAEAVTDARAAIGPRAQRTGLAGDRISPLNMQLGPSVQPSQPGASATGALQRPTAPGGAREDPGGYGKAAIGLGDLGALIERRLAQPSAYGTDEMMAMRNALATKREESRRMGASALDADAARRGAFHSTIPTMGKYRMERGLAEQEAMADAQLLDRMASARDAGSAQAVQEAMGFMQAGQGNEMQRLQLLGNLALGAGQLGQQGAPTMGGPLAALMQMGGGVQGFDPSLFQMLGGLMGGGNA